MSAFAVLAYAGITAAALAAVSFFFGIDYMEFWPRVILGIIGFGFMLIMHVYSVRKRKKDWSVFKNSGLKLSSFLTWHIVTATLGVTVIFFHAIGTYNSVIDWTAFLSMFIVWQSGFVGRYIFVKIPKDNTGLLKEKNQIAEDIESMNTELIQVMAKNLESDRGREYLMSYLENYSKSLQSLHKRYDESILRFFQNFGQILKAWKYYRENAKLISQGLSQNQDLDEKEVTALKTHMSEYEKKMRTIVLMHFQLEFYETLRALFRNWHDVHVPLNYLFYTTAILHIAVVILFSSSAN